jgi:glycosyltransferase involved in cell wall biosynthesis
MSPKVSVLVATYNCGNYLRETLHSVAAQTESDHEVVIVDDGSADGTDAVVRPFLADGRCRYYRIEHRGQPAAKNLAVAMSRAPLLAFLDADDVWLPDKLERQLVLLRERPDVAVVYSRRTLIDEAGGPVPYQQPVLHRGNILAQIFRDNFICFSSAVVRRQVFDKVGGFDERLPLAVDYELWLRVAACFSFDYVDAPLIRYRTGHASLSRRAEERLHIVINVMRRFLDERGGRRLIPARVIARAQAETRYHLALLKRDRTVCGSALWFLRSLYFAPWYCPAWKGLVSILFPEAGRRRLRQMMGRPVDWNQPHSSRAA